MGVLAWILRRRQPSAAAAAGEVVLRPPPPTPTQRPLEAPKPTPSMRRHGAGTTAATPVYRIPDGTPSTERLHNPRHVGR
jgi:hypothetical protein